MKLFSLIFTALVLAAPTSNAVTCMGKGQRYTTVRCEITSTKTYEAGYTEEYGKAIVNLLNTDTEGVMVDLGLASGNIQARVKIVNRNELHINFNQEMGKWGKTFTDGIKFPRQICGGTEENALNTTQTYIADFQTHAMNLDLNIDCKSYTFFEEEP